jgi:hypothetical protein
MTDVAKVEAAEIVQRQPVVSPQGVQLQQLLQLAVEKDISVESLEKLVNLYERMADRQAAQEFADALARFQGECPPIAKTSKAEIRTTKGGSYEYTFAPLEEIARTVNPLLHKHGLSYSWDSTHASNMITATCWLRHRNGHKEPATFSVPVENASAMNNQQKHGAALTYARRGSLVAVLGLTTAEPDTDNNDPTELISQDQLMLLKEALSEVQISKARLFKVLGHGITRLEDMPVFLYETAMNVIQLKRQQQNAVGASND